MNITINNLIKKLVQVVLAFLLVIVFIGCGEDKKIIVEFDTNGGSYISYVELNLESLDSFKLPENPTKDGYIFDGWYIDKEYTNKYSSLEEKEGKVVLYAKWNAEEIKEVTVKFITNGGAVMTDSVVAAQNLATFVPDTPVKEGYEFGGWFLDSAYTKAYTVLTNSAKEVTLYAKWNTITIQSITVVYNTNGGNTIPSETVKVANIDDYALPVEPAKDGFVFGGWYLDAGFNVLFTKLNNDKKEVTLYAKWNEKEITEIKVNYVTNGGKEIASDVVKVSDVASFELPTCEKDNYEFAGWFLDDKLTQAYNTLLAFEEEVTLYAKWDKIKVYLTFNTSKESIKKGEVLPLDIVVTGHTDTSFYFEISDPTLLSVNENNELVVIKEIKVDTVVNVKVIANADETVFASKTFTVIAPIVEGEVGDLTSKMLEDLGKSSLTVKGTLTDYYNDLKQKSNSTVHAYDMLVQMEEGAWRGSWSIKDNTTNVITDIYRKSVEDNLKDQYGNVGHGLNKVFINKNNVADSKIVRDYLSIPSLWETQHLWNHLGNLQIDKFTYDAENDAYKYNAKQEVLEDALLMTYLSYSLTPMLSDTLVDLYLLVEDGVITGLLGQTEILYYGENTEEDPDAYSYTKIEVSFSNVGTTTVDDPEPREAPQYAELLANALNKITSAKNYTFHANDVTTFAPSTDGSEYEVESTKKGRNLVSRIEVFEDKVSNNDSAVGTVGLYGQVTEDAVLLARTQKYSYTMDGKAYHTEYSGYKKIDDNSFDYFEYSSKTNALVGTKKINGVIADILPNFDFSPNVFRFAGQTIDAEGKSVYKFVLSDTAIIRDLALEVSLYSYADDAEASSTILFTIEVDSEGNLIRTLFPYSISSGTYIGYCETTYSNVGTTVIAEDTFTDYVPRVLKTSWSDYTMKYYSSTHSTLDSHEENAAVALDAIFGEDVSYLPAPSALLNILGDNINGPFFDWDEIGTDSEGKPIYRDYMSITTTSSEYDENSRITNYEELMSEIQVALEEYGFTLSPANTDTTGGENGTSDRYVCFINDKIQIVIENNHTKYLWVYFYKLGSWTLNRNA